MNRDLIYLASQYTDPDPEVMDYRFKMACAVAARLMRQGLLIYSPIVHSHSLALCGLPRDFSFWRDCDSRMIAACDQLWVLRMIGWEQSKGISEELSIARDMRKLIEFIDPTEDDSETVSLLMEAEI